MSNPANLKDYLEAMIRYHHKSGIGCINAEYNSKKNKRIKKVAPELLKELVEAKTWNNASWHRGAVNGLLEVYDIMHFGKTGATLLEEIPGITDSDILYAEVN
jgi:transcription elongation factor GreA-like protein